MPIRVYLVDDHELVRRGLRDLVEAEDDLCVVGEASTVAQAVTGLANHGPDVAIIDVRLPDGNGVDLCRTAGEVSPETACLILTSYPDERALHDAVVAGAVGFVLKEVRGNDLVRAIRAAAAGDATLDETSTAEIAARFRPIEEDALLRDLTPQERRILELVGQGMTNRQIGEAMFLAEKTVKNYVSNMLAKMGMQRRTEAAAYVARLEERRVARDAT